MCALQVKVTKLEEQFQEVDKLKRDVELAEREIAILLERQQEELVVSQISFMVNDAVLTYVLGGEHRQMSVYTVRHLEKAIDKAKRFSGVFCSECERKRAEERWTRLKSRVGWQDRHYRDLELLNNACLPCTHQTVPDIEQIYSVIDKLCGDDQHLKGVCVEFLEMLEKIKSELSN